MFKLICKAQFKLSELLHTRQVLSDMTGGINSSFLEDLLTLPYDSHALLHVVRMLFSNYVHIMHLNMPQERLFLKMYFLHLVGPTTLS